MDDDAPDDAPGHSPDDVPEDRATVVVARAPHLVSLVLLVAFGANTALIVGQDDPSVASWLRAVVGVVGALAVVVGWAFEVRHPARISVSADTIRWERIGRDNAKELVRSDRPVHMFTVGRSNRPKALAIEGEAAEVPLDRLDANRVVRAARRAGWTIGEPVHRRAKLEASDLLP